MATGDVVSGDQVKIFIDDAGAIGSAFNGTNDPTGALQYQAEVTNFNVEGGETDVDSVAVFGGFIDSIKPTSQITVSMDVIIRYGAQVLRWDTLRRDTARKMIAIQGTDGTNFYWNAFNNARITNFDKEFEAENEWRGTITLKLSPTDADGVDNRQEGDADLLTDLTAWA